MSFANQQCVIESGNIIPKGVAASFEFGSREQQFHPVIVFRDVIKTRNG